MIRFFFLLILFFSNSLTAKVFFDPPWGKDAELANSRKTLCQVEQLEEKSLGVQVCKVLIDFHQEVISPADGPRSHFKPSSSQYTMDAMKKYGFFQGWMMGADRLMRENSEKWVYPTITVEGDKVFKLDPVR